LLKNFFRVYVKNTWVSEDDNVIRLAQEWKHQLEQQWLKTFILFLKQLKNSK
jgi:hypothetical protein